MARLDFSSLLRWSGVSERWRSAVAEGAQAAEDRLTLVRMEWEEHRHRLFLLVLLLIFSGALVLVALLLLSIALLVQFWDTPYRTTVAWVLAAVWCAASAVAIAWLMRLAREARGLFALTRRELAEDWRALRGQL